MIEIRPERRADALEPLYKQRGLKINENSTAAVAYDGGTVIGFCLFDMERDRLTVRCIEPEGDIMFADGLLRSALHIGTENGIMTAFYSDEAPVHLLKKLKFVKSETEKELDVSLLFKSCKNCG